MMGQRTSWLECSFVLLLLALLMCWDSSVLAKKKKNDIIKKCETCNDLVKKFNEGIERTDRYNFAGGDVDWEEKKLGSYATSETRFIEITEQLCSSSAHECHSMLEEQEESLEEWWKEHQESDPDLAQWFCIDRIKVCCPENRYGPECEECIGGLERPCRDNGKCSGGGTRGGSGKCKCNGGYKGWYCEVCKNGFYEELKNDTHTICKACDDACASTCTGAGPKACSKCKGGYLQDEEEGCKDIDECNRETHEDPCTVNQFCENSRGSYKCVDCDASCNRCLGAGNNMCVSCKEGYKIEEGACIDINECEKEDICQSDMSCNNLPGTYYCDCKEGLTRMGGECVDKEIVQALKDKGMNIPDPEIGVKDNGEEANSNTIMDENNANLDAESAFQEPDAGIQPSSQEETVTQETKEHVGDDLIVDGSFHSHQDIPAAEQGAEEGITQPDSGTNTGDIVDKINNSYQTDGTVAAENVERTEKKQMDNGSQSQEIREEL